VWVKVRRDALSLADRDITTATWEPERRAQNGDFRREFSHALPVRAVDGRIHGQREREERERDGGRVRGGHTAAETFSDCGVLWVS